MVTIKNKKIKIAQQILKDLKIPLWFVNSAEGSDPTFAKLVGKEIAPSFLILSPTKKRIIVSSLDLDNFKKYGWENDLITYSPEDFKKHFIGTLKEFGFDGKMALNYTTMKNIQTDKITSGIRDWIDGLVMDSFPELSSGKNVRDVLFSGEKILYALYDRKTSDEISQMELAANRALNILEETFTNLKPGMKDWDAYNLVQRITLETRDSFLKKNNLVSEEYAWNSESCPIVLTGKSWTKGGHAETCGEIIEPGNTVYFDFGVKLHFQDGTHWCSDIQRMGYALRDKEILPSPEAQRVFDILYNSVSKGIDALRPGVKGHEVDKIVRDVINREGYDYDHGTGHSIGEEAHGIGTFICYSTNPPRAEQLEVQPNGVYTIEPRIPIVNGASIEEMVLVNPKGKNRTLCPRQEELYLIR